MVEVIVNLFSIVTHLVTEDYCCYFYIFLQHSISMVQSEETIFFENSFLLNTTSLLVNYTRVCAADYERNTVVAHTNRCIKEESTRQTEN